MPDNTPTTIVDDGFTDAERSYFQTGEASDQLIAENNSANSASADPGTVEPAAKAVAEPAAVEPAEPAEAAEPAEPSEAGEQQQRRVGFTKYQEAVTRAQELERKLNEQGIRNARVEERLTLLQQALQPQEAPQEVPDPEKDIFGYVRHLEREMRAQGEKISTYEQQLAAEAEQQQEERRYFEDMNTYAQSEPNMINAYNFLLRVRGAELLSSRYPDATPEQLFRAQIPPDIGAQLREEERALYRDAFERGVNPGAQIMRFAQMRGFQPPARPVQPGAQPAAQPPQAGAQPAAPLPAATMRTAVPAVPPARNAQQLVESLQKGQRAATSLSQSSGTSPATELTPQALAEMSEEEFEAIFNELTVTGQRQKLMSLMGN